MKFFKKQKTSVISQVTTLAMIFGFAAGVVGQIVADVYIDPWRETYIINTSIQGQNDLVIPELRRVKRFLGIEQDFEVNKSIEKIQPSVVGVYLAKSSSAGLLNQVYLPDELLANGFVLTSDGWLVSASDVFDQYSVGRLAVAHAGRIYSIDQAIVDPITGVTFLKIPASNLAVAVLGDSAEATLGQLEVVVNNFNQAIVTNIKSLGYQTAEEPSDVVLTSETYGKRILISDGMTSHYLGSPLVNLGGEVIGIIESIDEAHGLAQAVPINQFRSTMLDVLRSSLVKRSFLGVSYVDLAHTVGVSEELSQGLRRGALVNANPARGTPAFDAGVFAGDIILSVEGQPIDKDSSLTALVQQYQPGDEITLELLRAGQTVTVTTILEILPESR